IGGLRGRTPQNPRAYGRREGSGAQAPIAQKHLSTSGLELFWWTGLRNLHATRGTGTGSTISDLFSLKHLIYGRIGPACSFVNPERFCTPIRRHG
ncbi:MAG: hypothetical protein AB7G34_05960, partial [Hyphomicrobiales bacterium]